MSACALRLLRPDPDDPDDVSVGPDMEGKSPTPKWTPSGAESSEGAVVESFHELVSGGATEEGTSDPDVASELVGLYPPSPLPNPTIWVRQDENRPGPAPARRKRPADCQAAPA